MKEHIGFREIQRDEFSHTAVDGEGSPCNEGLVASVSPQLSLGQSSTAVQRSVTWLCLHGPDVVCVLLTP